MLEYIVSFYFSYFLSFLLTYALYIIAISVHVTGLINKLILKY
jgi:hypothetical protein